ncbi:unnamed protein product [Discula destructiva]
MNKNAFSLTAEAERPEDAKPPRRRLAPAPPDARWDPTALPSDEEDDDEPRWTELQLAARAGGAERVNEILARYPDVAERARIVNAPPQGWYSQTALQAACMHQHEAVVRILLDAGADIGAPGGNNIYMNAFEYACGTGNIRLVHLLLDAGATQYVNRARPTRYQGRTPIQAAAESGDGSTDLVDLLLSRGADINAAPSPCGGLTALQAACFEGHAGMVRHLLARGANVNAAAARQGGVTALQGACRVGERDIADMLLAAGAEVNARGDRRGVGGTALHAAAEGGHGEIVRVLLAAGADCNALAGRAGMRGQTAVQSAYVQGHREVVAMLMEAGATGPVNGGRKLFRFVEVRSWSIDEMGIACGGDEEEEEEGEEEEEEEEEKEEERRRGRFPSAVRQRAASPNPMVRRVPYQKKC